MSEPGEIRRRDDGTFEYLRSVEMSMRRGVIEQWESVVEHAAKNMRLPQEFFENLLRHGYQGGPHLYDLMVSEGWSAPRRDYVELTKGKPLIETLHDENAGPAVEAPKGGGPPYPHVSPKLPP